MEGCCMKQAILIRKMYVAGTNNLVMEYYRKIDREKYQFDFIVDSDSNAIPEEEIKALGCIKLHPISTLWDGQKISTVYVNKTTILFFMPTTTR